MQTLEEKSNRARTPGENIEGDASSLLPPVLLSLTSSGRKITELDDRRLPLMRHAKVGRDN